MDMSREMELGNRQYSGRPSRGVTSVSDREGESVGNLIGPLLSLKMTEYEQNVSLFCRNHPSSDIWN
jgi:hypothetical protein